MEERPNFNKKEKQRLIDYLKETKPEDLFDRRDRALVLLIVRHELGYRETAEINLRYCGGASITIPAPGKKRILLSSLEKEVLFEYIVERIKLRLVFTRQIEYLFIDHKMRNLTPADVRAIVKRYVKMTKEDK